MRSFRRIFVSTMCGVLLSVSALAAPIDFTALEMTVQATSINYGDNDTAVTANSFVATAPYVVTLDVATHVPIAKAVPAKLNASEDNGNTAVMQNGNFERISS